MTKTEAWTRLRWAGGAGALLALTACTTLPSLPGDLATLPLRARTPRAALAVVPGTTYGADPYAAAYAPAAAATAQLRVTVAAAAAGRRYRTLALGAEVARVVVALTHLRTGQVEGRLLGAADLARPLVVVDYKALPPGPVVVHAVAIGADERPLAEGTAEGVLVAGRAQGLAVALGAPAPAQLGFDRAHAAGPAPRAAGLAARNAPPAGCRDFMALDVDRSGAVDLDEFRQATAPAPAPVAWAPTPDEGDEAPYACDDEDPGAYDDEDPDAHDDEDPDAHDDEDPDAYNAADLITNNAGPLISRNAGGLISNNPGGLITNSQGGLISNHPGSPNASNAGCLISSSAGCMIASDAPDPAAEGFRALDADVDGLLSPEELCGWEAPATPRAAR